MQEEGILRVLGSQPLPLRGDGVGRSHDLPATGNMLEMQDWKPPSYHTVLLQRQGKRFTSTAPSQRSGASACVYVSLLIDYSAKLSVVYQSVGSLLNFQTSYQLKNSK